jgi:hypothetical protein
LITETASEKLNVPQALSLFVLVMYSNLHFGLRLRVATQCVSASGIRLHNVKQICPLNELFNNHMTHSNIS